MKKKLLCVFTCMSLLLVACSGKSNSGSGSGEKSYSDYVTLGEYKGMELTRESGEVTDQDLQDKIDSILSENSSTEQIKKGKVKDGDTVNIDFVGKIDGEAFDGGTADGQSLTIGSGSFIDGFEDQLIGVKVGDTVDINVTFPEDYGKDELNGKDAVFTVTVNYINGETTTPKWTDNFVQGISDYTTTEDYEQELWEELEEQLDETIEYDLQNQMVENLIDSSEFKELPQDDVDAYAQDMIDYYKQYAEQYGQEYEDLIQNTFSMDVETFEAQVQTTAEEEIKKRIVLYAVADKEGIIPEGDDMDEQKLDIATQYGYEDVASFEDQYGEDYSERLVIKQVALDFIEENAVITDAPATSATADAEPTEETTATEDAE